MGKDWKRERHSRDAVTSRLRLRDYDYSLPGDYFVTICTTGGAHLFGHVEDDCMVHSTAGLMIDSWWHTLPRRFPIVCLDEMVVMPNHLHGIVELTTPDGAGADGARPDLSRIIEWFKSITTNDYMRGVRTDGWPRFAGTLWQDGYHDHIVRDERALDRVRTYIAANPSQWHRDEENPNRVR